MSEWRDAIGFGGKYEISDGGEIRNKKTGRILKQHISEFGYKKINLPQNGRRAHVRVHRLVAEAFIPNPSNKPQVNHKNGDKLDNRKDNLEWVDGSENITHCYRNIRKCGCSPASKSVVCVENGVIYDSISSAARAFGVSIRAIQRVIGYDNRKSCGRHWKLV